MAIQVSAVKGSNASASPISCVSYLWGLGIDFQSETVYANNHR